MNHKLIMGTGLAIVLSGCVLFDSTPDGLVFHCTFDDQTSISNPAVGPAGKINNAKFEQGKINKALFVPRGLSACEFPIPVGMLSDKGCIEFWAKFKEQKNQFTTGGDPRFFTFYNSNGGRFGLLEFASNNGMGRSGLSGVFGDVVTTHNGFSRTMDYSAIFKTSSHENWHHYALIWNKNGIRKFEKGKEPPRLVILMDGQRVSATYTKAPNDLFFTKLGTADLNLGIPMNLVEPPPQSKSSFLIDEFKIWNFDKTDFDELQ